MCLYPSFRPSPSFYTPPQRKRGELPLPILPLPTRNPSFTPPPPPREIALTHPHFSQPETLHLQPPRKRGEITLTHPKTLHLHPRKRGKTMLTHIPLPIIPSPLFYTLPQEKERKLPLPAVPLPTQNPSFTPLHPPPPPGEIALTHQKPFIHPPKRGNCL